MGAGSTLLIERGREMKKVIAMLAILMVFACSAFAITNGDEASLLVTLTIRESEPVLTLLGSSDNGATYNTTDVAFGTLSDSAIEEGIKAYFKVQYGAYRWNKSITVSARATDLTNTDATITTTGAATVSTITNPTMSFSGTSDEGGEFASFNVSYDTTGLASGEYTSTVTVIYTINS